MPGRGRSGASALLRWALLLPWMALASVSAAPIVVNGLPAKETERFMATLRPRLEFIEKRAATSFRADDAAYLLERLMLRKGYPEVSVMPSVRGRSIQLDVSPGPRYLIGPLSIKAPDLPGIDKETLEGYFFQPLIERELVRREQAPYIEDYEIEGANNVTQFLNSAGYWSATSTVSPPGFDRQRGLATFTLTVSPGRLLTMARPVVISPGSLPQKLRRKLDELAGQPATSANLSKVRQLLRESLQSRGYQFAEISIDIRHSSAISTVTARVDPGRRYRFGKPEVTGLNKTVERRFLRPYLRLRGEAYDEEKLNAATNKLLKTGAFTSIRVSPRPGDSGLLDYDIEATEGKARGYNFYAGAGSVEGPIVGVGYYDHNFRGKLYNLSTRIEVSGLGPLGEIKLVEPFFLGENIGFTSRLYIQNRIFDEYNKTESGLGFNWDYDFTREIAIDVFADLAYTDISADGLPPEEIGQDAYIAASVGTNLEFDYRDNPVNPTKGWLASSSFELFEVIGDQSSLPFAKINGRFSAFQPLGEKWQLAGGARTGLIFPLGESAELPIDERFFLGGPDSVRSFPWRDLGPRPETVSLNRSVGGEAFWTVNAEIHRKIAGPLWVIAFTDAGANSRRVGDLFATDPEIAAGIGLRLKLPVGPVRLEYGHNLTKDPGEPNGAWHFAIGVAF